MDGAFQSLAVGLLQDADSSFYLPVGMDRLECFSPVAGEVWSHAQWRDVEGEVRTADLTLFDSQGTVLARIEKLKLRAVRRAALRQLAGSGPERLIYSLRWQTASLESGNDAPSHWLVVRQATNERNALARTMADRNQRCIDVQLRRGASDVDLERKPELATSAPTALAAGAEGHVNQQPAPEASAFGSQERTVSLAQPETGTTDPEFDGDVCWIDGGDPKQWGAVLKH
jgi:hypothetical protein